MKIILKNTNKKQKPLNWHLENREIEILISKKKEIKDREIGFAKVIKCEIFIISLNTFFQIIYIIIFKVDLV